MSEHHRRIYTLHPDGHKYQYKKCGGNCNNVWEMYLANPSLILMEERRKRLGISERIWIRYCHTENDLAQTTKMRGTTLWFWDTLHEDPPKLNVTSSKKVALIPRWQPCFTDWLAAAVPLPEYLRRRYSAIWHDSRLPNNGNFVGCC